MNGTLAWAARALASCSLVDDAPVDESAHGALVGLVHAHDLVEMLDGQVSVQDEDL